MNESTKTELLRLTQRLVDCVVEGDWDTYVELCDPTLTAIEPEARGHLVEGMDFHRFYFDNLSFRSAVNTTIANPHVRFLGEDVAVICYVRLIQKITSSGTAETYQYEETRIWERQAGRWKHVHFHRSQPN